MRPSLIFMREIRTISGIRWQWKYVRQGVTLRILTSNVGEIPQIASL